MLFLTLVLTLWVIILVPVYWQNYGPENFLWLSDIGLFGTVIALWFRSRLLMSVMALTVLPVELAWNIDFFVHLFTNYFVMGVSHYMFNADLSFFLRGISLFHIFMPFVWIWYILQWGYDKRSFLYATVLSWIIFIATYFFTNPQTNINWVFSSYVQNWQWISPQAWLLLLMIAFPVLGYWPLHKLFMYFVNQKICPATVLENCSHKKA